MKTDYKVHLGPEMIPGYWNTDDISLSNVETNQCTELVIDLALGRIPIDKIRGVMNNWISKLRYGAKIVINDLDILQLSKAVITKKTSVMEINKLLYNDRVSCLTLEDTCELIKSLGLNITRKSLVEFEYSVEAERR